jgi:hypothetical protein
LAISYEEALELIEELEPRHQTRHSEHQRLRDFWHGRYWNRNDEPKGGIASIFMDIKSKRDGLGPDIELVRNLIFDVCVKYQTYLSSLPMIRTFVDMPGPNASHKTMLKKRADATLKERALYGTWSESNMNMALNEIAWFGPLMGDSFLGIWPDFEKKCVTSFVRSPEHAYPIASWDGKLRAILFKWKITEREARRQFKGKFEPKPKPKRRGQHVDESVEILEYSDAYCFQRWADGQLVNGVEHKLGFNLVEQVPFIRVPGEPWNHGAVEQSVGLVEAGNVLYSLMMQAMLENVFPKMVLEDPMKFGETLDTGPGAVIPVNAGGKAYYLPAPTSAIQAGAGLLAENERAIKQDTSMPDASFGQFDASIITGKAISQLQGAGTGALVEMVQGSTLGQVLTSWNEKALTIYQKMFPNDTIYLHGLRPESYLDLNPAAFALSFKGSDIKGSPRNEVVFSPAVGMHEKLIISLQAQGAGLTSKKHGREQIGIPDSDQMEEEIFNEQIDAAVLGAIVQSLTDPTYQGAEAANAQAGEYLAAKPSQTPPMLPPPGLPPGAPPPGPPGSAPPGPSQIGAPVTPSAAPMPPPPAGMPQGMPVEAPAAPGAGGGNIVTLDQAMTALLALQGIAGQVFLVGEIIETGQTDDAVEIAVTDPADRQTIKSGVQFDVVFHVVQGEPQEQFLEATPGADPRSGGAEPDLAALGV